MRDLREARPAGWPAVLLLSGLLVVFGTACASTGSAPVARGERLSRAIPLPLGSWATGQLHCEAGSCERWYELAIDDGGLLKVDLYAPVGPGVPDCEMQLQTPDGELLPARTRRIRTQRRLTQRIGADTYYLRVASRGEARGQVGFEVVANLTLEPPGRTPSARPAPKSRQPASRPPPPRKPRPDVPMATRPPSPPEAESKAQPEAPPGAEDGADAARTAEELLEEAPAEEGPEITVALPPPPEPSWIVAEVLDVEEDSGAPVAVMIEAGEPSGVREGMQGELFEGDAVIGEIVVTDVYPTGSRARIVGALSAPVGFDTLSRVLVPPDEE